MSQKLLSMKLTIAMLRRLVKKKLCGCLIMGKKEFFFYLSLLGTCCVVLPVVAYQVASHSSRNKSEVLQSFYESPVNKKSSQEQEIAYTEERTPSYDSDFVAVEQDAYSLDPSPLMAEQNSNVFVTEPEVEKSVAKTYYKTVRQMVDNQTTKISDAGDQDDFLHPQIAESREVEESEPLVPSTQIPTPIPENLNQERSFLPPVIEPLSPPSSPTVAFTPVPLSYEPNVYPAPYQASCETSYQCLSYNAWEYPQRLYVDYVEGRWLDNHEGYTSLGVFYAFRNIGFCEIVPFIDLRYHIFNDGKRAANFGGGLRYINYQRRMAFGINAYYDFRKGSWNHYYKDIGLGVEILSPCVDVRLNGYIPVGKRDAFSSARIFDQFEGDFLATCRQKRSSLWGVDGEVGRWLKRKCPCDFFDLYGAIGWHYFSSRDHHKKDLYGGDVRLLTNLGSFFVFELRGGYDSVYHGMVQGRLTLSVPTEMLGYGLSYLTGTGPIAYDCCKPACNPCCGEFFEPVQRQEIMVLSKKDCCWTWNWEDEGCECSDK